MLQHLEGCLAHLKCGSGDSGDGEAHIGAVGPSSYLSPAPSSGLQLLLRGAFFLGSDWLLCKYVGVPGHQGPEAFPFSARFFSGLDPALVPQLSCRGGRPAK